MAGDCWLIRPLCVGLDGKCWLAGKQMDLVIQQQWVLSETNSAVQTTVSVMQTVKTGWKAALAESFKPRACNNPRMLKHASLHLNVDKEKGSQVNCSNIQLFTMRDFGLPLLSFKMLSYCTYNPATLPAFVIMLAESCTHTPEICIKMIFLY